MITLSSLPLELLQNIADCVHDAYRPSLFAFSLTSKACNAASAILIFQQISILVNKPDGLQRDTSKLLEALSRADSARHVRCIHLNGDVRVNALKINMFNQEYGPQTDWRKDHGLDEILVDEEPIDYTGNHVVYDEPVIKRGSAEDTAWTPIIRLLNMTPCLKDLVYDCDSQFPPSVLDKLREQHPRCRLHHLSFRFRTLLWGSPYPYEMELATYPSLYRLRVSCAMRDTNGDDDFNEEALMELVAQLAPELKEVTVLSLFPRHSNRLRRVRDSWRSLPGFTGDRVGSLTSLHIRGHPALRSPERLQVWARHTDFTCLRELSLGGAHKANSSGLAGETMKWVAQNCSFPQLKILNVWLWRDDMFLERPHYSENVVDFFSAFEPLERLTVQGPLDLRAVDVILSRHGPKLQTLGLHPFESDTGISNARPERDIPLEFTRDLIQQIQTQCLKLEELSIPIKRDLSSAAEAEIYKCFKKMSQLRHLFLNLDCSNWRVTRDDLYKPQYDDEDQKPVPYDTYLNQHQQPVYRPSPIKIGELKLTFINAAVDEALARSIWVAASHNKTGRRLETLKLWTTGAGSWGGLRSSGRLPYIGGFAQDLSRSWLIERSKRYDDEGIAVRELGQTSREREQRYTDCSHQSKEFEVFQTIWSSKEGSRSWRDDWSSFPLQG